MRKISLVAALMALLSMPVLAAGHDDVDKQYELKDGSTVFIYKDGKMAMEDKFGRPTSMKEGHKMETKDGQIIMMKGNELWRREALKPRG